MAKFQSHAQYQNNFLWTLVSPVVAMLVAIPLSVALVTHIVHAELSNDLVALKAQQTTQMAPVANTTAATQSACAGTVQATQKVKSTSTTPAVTQTASVKMPTTAWANPMHSGYAKSYTKVSNNYVSKKTVIVDSYNDNSKNYNSGNKTSTTVNSTTTNTASGGSTINSSTSANTTAVNGDKNLTGVYNNQSSSVSSTTANTTTNNTTTNNVDSNNTINSNNKTKVDVDSHDKTVNLGLPQGNCGPNVWCDPVRV